MQWVTITVVGQSFVLHQIRKMIGILSHFFHSLTLTQETPNSYNHVLFYNKCNW
jgi:tRNA U38,U39,U40 pseudouridine synthase TruA